MTKRTQYVATSQLPRDDQTLRQAKAVVRYQHPAARNVKASWNDPSNKAHGANVTWEEN